ncbi:hybrid sensor histidine kinase/response regulator [Desulfolutivibrio sulfoxidireducens]|uniref:hybrid sensor histidine kinase/response regulator n=1 Tax=Desulfolutivibrio sulfoxidireducens TaxID=2773299 RepID=UPI00159E0453|nr:ATP-binding protein [Desulfolutivibrio sulfoxidireducens]QLA14869.1 response regulator [Desulfolutivibrio sulfoxidireducens]QLA18439.1 response regulator [Desulfolutivibrio sulfoxidireducens]
MARILLVEDEPLLRVSMADHLADQGHEVFPAWDGLTGLGVFEAESPDLVLLDLFVPGLSGLDLLARARRLRPDVPIIIVSGAGGMAEVITALRLGAVDFLTKPMADLEILDHAVARALERAEFFVQRRRYALELERQVNERTSELARANAALRESQSLFQELVENIRGIFWVRDLDGDRLLYVSPACDAILGGPCRDILRDAEAFLEYVHPEDRAVLREVTRNRRSKTAQSLTYRFQRPDGRTVWISSRRFPIFDETGRMVRLAGVAEDVTDRIEAEAESREKDRHLVQADKMIALGIMAAGVAHEINNPNHLIGLNAATLAALLPRLRESAASGGAGGAGDAPPDVDREEAWKMAQALVSGIAAGSGRITGIVRRMKEFARPDDGAMDQPVDLRQVVEQALELVRNRIDKATRSLVVDMPPEPLMVRGSRNRLEQVVVNLLLNAAEALPSPEKGIRAALWEAGRTVVLTVRDQGTGIEPGILRRIADPFFTTKREKGGLGLGLSVSMNIVKALGGELVFHSRPGQGTLATLTLPVAEAS